MTIKKYVSDDPKLMAEWDWDKNEKLNFDPYKISYGSAQKVWWKCKEGHGWFADPNHRTRGRGCPFCAQINRAKNREKSYITKNGSLADNNPKLASQWHPTLNGDLKPSDVTVNYTKKVYWLCDKGHIWQASVHERNNSGSGCTVCSGHKLVVGVNDLATVNPSLASEWHPTKNGNLTPQDVTAHNGKKVYWLCSKGHEWAAKISNRSNGDNCPICFGKKVLVGYNDLFTVNLRLALEWHPDKNGNLTPMNVTAHSNKKVWWLCKKGHEWEATVSHRSNGRGCPKCFSESRTSFPEQAIFYYFNKVTVAYNRYILGSGTEIDIYLPEYKIGIEYDGFHFHKGEEAEKREKRKEEKLECEGIFLIRVKEVESNSKRSDQNNIIYTKIRSNDLELNEVINNIFCLVNNLRNLSLHTDIDINRDRSRIYDQYIESEKENSLLVKNPALAAQWHPTKNGDLLPENVSVSSNKSVWWQCPKKHEWQAVINSRNQGAGCPVCSGHKILVGFNDLETVSPSLAKQWHPTKNGKLTAKDVTISSNIIVWWKCEKGHEWKTSVAHRRKEVGCPYCANKKVLVGYNDLATVNPQLASEWHPTKNGVMTPQSVTVGSDKKVWWLGKCGHEWDAVISSRNSGVGCPYCAGQKVLNGFNDLATINPELAKEWHPNKNGKLKPSDVMPNTNKKVWWLGKCGHEWEADISSRNSGVGCPYCAGQKVIKGYNDLATINPELAQEWHPIKNGKLKPYDVMPNSNRKVWWLGKCGHEWENTVNSRNSGHKCPYCCNQKLLKGFNDLKTTNPKLAEQWHPTKNGDLKPTDCVAGANRKVWWKCPECGYEWAAMINSRNQGRGCPECAIKRRAEKRKKRRE